MEQQNRGALALFGPDGCVRVDASRGRGNEWMHLNDLHRASGGERAKEPSEWLSLAGTKALVEARSGDHRIESFRVVRGGNGEQGTDAHWELAVAYAEWLSPAFHLRVIREWRAFNELAHLNLLGELSSLRAAIEEYRADAIATHNRTARIEAKLAELGDGVHASKRDIQHLREEKAECARLTAANGLAESVQSASSTLHREMLDAAMWPGRMAELPRDRLPFAERFLRLKRIKLERIDALRSASAGDDDDPQGDLFTKH